MWNRTVLFQVSAGVSFSELHMLLSSLGIVDSGLAEFDANGLRPSIKEAFCAINSS